MEDPEPACCNSMHSAAVADFPLIETGERDSEHLINYPTQYAEALVINFNHWPATPGRGAGIFLHVNGRGATAGCVSVPRATMDRIMAWIQPGAHPRIAIGRGPGLHTDGEMMSETQRPRARSRLLITGTVLAVLGALTAAGALWSVLSSYTVVTARSAMEPTYHEGDRVMVERSGGDDVRRGDVVLYGVPDRYMGLPVLQRVIGLGGDRVVFADGTLTVNGSPADEPYVKEADSVFSSAPYDVRVPAGRMFLLGDNRGNSNDSRYFLSEESGTVPTAAVQGRALKSGGAPVELGLAVVLGVLVTLGGGICALAGRRSRPVGYVR
ncbi:signal peptidase I [Streptomyces sp. NPDC005776]|uniref:signal peptidase I n=1 Tax=unclassified Streptomyces TaxID=2593676 RepID=UPI0034092B41